jgi:Ca2+-binding EF-hand superfamily protein
MKTSILLMIASLGLSMGVSHAHKGGKGGPKTVPADVLAKYDTDGDGVLSATEKTAMKAALAAEAAAKKAELIAKYDADGDGVLNAAERETAHAAMVAAKFAELDKDASGGLSAAEFAAGAPEGATAEHAASHFAKIDADADGSVTLAEFSAKPAKKGKGRR